MNRTSKDVCLLCGFKPSTKKNSHWVPAAMLKSMVGKRYNEESYQFSSFQKRKLDVYYGRDNLKNTDTTIKQNHYSLDYIFCDDCENKLGVLESAVIPVIQNEIRLERKRPNYKEELGEDGITLKKCLRLNNNIFRLFIYSIVWRFSLIHQLEDNIQLISKDLQEDLRLILNESLSLDLKEIIENDSIHSLVFQVFTADSFDDGTEGTVYSEEIHKDPALFFVNEFIILFYGNEYTITGEYYFPIERMIQSVDVLNSKDDHPKIGFISNASFNELINRIFGDGAKVILTSLTNSVASCTGLSFIESRYHLYKLGMDIHQKTGSNIIQSFEEAAELICSNN
ncbi:hypothetical protein [Zhouia amylolytica]|uniref:hypothetical protein n=1 Tax=Zhouia amylolytica TaxID=376730 RepID=UPI0020CD4702|nr:hypothetical protein [Zhouia amylolytica]MCQ0110300.1 hypothetical protein [Zhouia amylolytica]